MYQFLSILLKISLIYLDVNCFKSLWYQLTYATISPTCQFEVKDYPCLTKRYMSYTRFVQIHAAFHWERGTSQEWDKYHWLKNPISHRNKAAKRTLVLGKEMSFNEGGNPSKSNYYPIRQYNNSKSDKYRIDFFILANVSCGHNFIYYIDAYQGKNEQNIGIKEDLWKLPMTQKVVVNAIFSTRLYIDPNWFCKLYIDNRYSAPELFVILKTKYKILECVTIWTKRLAGIKRWWTCWSQLQGAIWKRSDILSIDFSLDNGRITR